MQYPDTQMYSISTYIYHVNHGMSRYQPPTGELIPDFGLPSSRGTTSPYITDVVQRQWRKAMNPSACFNDIIKRLGEWGAGVDENHEDLFFF